MSRDQYMQAAFEAICTQSEEPRWFYVCLVERYQRYGGPEEGGWWQTMSELKAYQQYANRELAEEAAGKVRELAEELKQNAQREHGEHCLRQMEWLEARGLDADYLPENDGPEEYDVTICEELPVYDNTPMQYA